MLVHNARTWYAVDVEDEHVWVRLDWPQTTPWLAHDWHSYAWFLKNKVPQEFWDEVF